MDNISKTIGENIRKYRKLRGMTREQLAEAIDVDTNYLGQCERGERKLGLDKTIDIILIFGITASDIISIHTPSSTENKEKYLMEINAALENCTDNQLLTILNSLKCIVPFLK